MSDINMSNDITATEEQDIDKKSKEELLSALEHVKSNIEKFDDGVKSILFYELGLIKKYEFKDDHKAMINFQKSHDCDPNLIINLRTVRKIFLNKENWDLALDIINMELELNLNDTVKLYLEILKLEIKVKASKDFSSISKNFEKIVDKYKLDPLSIFKIKRIYVYNEKYQEYIDFLEKFIFKIDNNLKYIFIYELIIFYYKYNLKLSISISVYIKTLYELNKEIFFSIPDLDFNSLLSKILNDENLNNRIYEVYKIYKNKLKNNSEANRFLINNYPNVRDDYLALEELENHYKSSYNWEKYIDINGKKIKIIEDNEEKSNIYFNVGKIYFDKMDNLDRAKYAFESAVKYNKNNIAAIKELGKIAYTRNDKENLIKYHIMEAEILKSSSLKSVMYFRIAELYFNDNDFENAVEYYSKSIELDSNYWPSMEKLLESYKKLEKWEKYIEVLKDRLNYARNDERDFINYDIAKIYLERLEDFENAKKYFKNLPSRDYEDSVTSYLYYIYKQEGNWEALIELYNKKIKESLNPREKIKYLLLISKIYLYKLEDKKNSIQNLKKILKITPNYLPAIKELSVIYKENNDWTNLIELNLEEVKQAKSYHEKSSIYSDIAYTYYEKVNDVAKALNYYEKAYNEDKQNIYAINALKNIYNDFEDKEKLVSFYESRIELNTSIKVKSAYCCKIAEILYEDEELEKSVEYYEKAIKLNPNDGLAFNSLSIFYLENRKFDKLIKLLENKEKKNDYDFFELAQINYMFLDNSQKAEEYMLQAIATKPREEYFNFLITVYYTSNTKSIIKMKNTYKKFLSKEDCIILSQYILSIADITSYNPVLEMIEIFNEDRYSIVFYDLMEIFILNQMWDDLIRIILIRLQSSNERYEIMNLNFHLAKINHFYKKDYNSAITYYNKIIKYEQNHVLAKYLRDRCGELLGDKNLSAVNSSEDIRILYEKAIIFANSKKYKEAIKLLEEAYKLSDVSNIELISKLLEFYLKDEQYTAYIEFANIHFLRINRSDCILLINRSIELMETVKVDEEFLSVFIDISHNYLDRKNWNNLILDWIDKSGNLFFIRKYVNILLKDKNHEAAYLFLEKELEKSNDLYTKSSLYNIMGKIDKSRNDVFKSLKNYKKSFKLQENINSLKEIQDIYISKEAHVQDILREFPYIIKNNINYIFLLEGIFHALKSINKKEYAYNIAKVLLMLNSENKSVTEFLNNNEIYPLYYDYYSNKIGLYFYPKYDNIHIRKIFSLAIEGMSKLSKKTANDYNKLEKIGPENREIWNIFTKIRNRTTLKELELYVLRDGTSYNIDYIYPDSLALVVPEIVFKINKDETTYLIAKAVDRLLSYNFLLKYHSNQELSFMIKGIVNFILKDSIFTEKESLSKQKLFSRALPRALKKELFELEDILTKIDWARFNFDNYYNDSYITSTRIGLLASKDIGASIRAILKENGINNNNVDYSNIAKLCTDIPEIDGLVKYAISDSLVTLKNILGVKLDKI